MLWSIQLEFSGVLDFDFFLFVDGHEMLDIKYKWFNRGCNESCDEVFIYERNLANFDITKAVKTTEKTTYHTGN